MKKQHEIDLNEARIDNFMTHGQSGTDYSGGVPGESSTFAQLSHVEPSITAADFPGDLMDYSEVKFYLAEAAQRGYAVGASAAVHYADAIRASIEFWGGTATEVTAYISQPSVAYSAANWKKNIGEQIWIALYNRSYDAWNVWRKLDYPHLEPATDAVSDIPIRFPYPVGEQNVNDKNRAAAAEALGGDGDEVTTMLWFDKF